MVPSVGMRILGYSIGVAVAFGIAYAAVRFTDGSPKHVGYVYAGIALTGAALSEVLIATTPQTP